MTHFTTENPLKLYYFDVPGKGEPIRLACHYGGLPFSDIRLNGEQFSEMKALGELPFGQLPVIEVGGRYIGQSATILRFVGKLTGLYPVDDHVQAAVIDSLLDQEIDLFMGLSVARYRGRFGFECLTPEALATIAAALNNEILPRHLEFYENFLRKSKTGWLADTAEPSIIEFMLVPRLQWLVAPGVHEGISTEILDAFPLLKDMVHRFLHLPKIQQYYEEFAHRHKK